MNEERQRYLAFEIISENPEIDIPQEEFVTELWKKVHELWGAAGAARSGLYLINYDGHFKTGLIRYAHTFRNELEAALCRITSLSGTRVLVTSIVTCATVHRAKKKAKDRSEKFEEALEIGVLDNKNKK